PIQDRVEGCDIERHRAAGSLFDAGGDVVAMSRPVLELGQDEQLRGSLLEGMLIGWRPHILESNIYESNCGRQTDSRGHPSKSSYRDGPNRARRWLRDCFVEPARRPPVTVTPNARSSATVTTGIATTTIGIAAETKTIVIACVTAPSHLCRAPR